MGWERFNRSDFEVGTKQKKNHDQSRMKMKCNFQERDKVERNDMAQEVLESQPFVCSGGFSILRAQMSASSSAAGFNSTDERSTKRGHPEVRLNIIRLKRFRFSQCLVTQAVWRAKCDTTDTFHEWGLSSGWISVLEGKVRPQDASTIWPFKRFALENAQL